MLKTLGRETKGFRLVSVLTPIFMIAEVIMEMIIPKLMASIIDNGVTPGNMQVIYTVGAQMVVAALFGLLFGILGAVAGSHAATGFARNLRRGMFRNIQTFSFANIDKYSTAGLVTRMTTDVTNIQNAYQMLLRMSIRAPASMIVALIMSFAINRELASVYLVAVILLGGALVFIMSRATQYFIEAFRKYDDLNESVQENVSAIRVVKAYVREKFEGEKFRKDSENVRNLLMRAELILDDSTSAVDTATDAKIRHSFAEKIPGTTVFIIAQRISSVENADKVLVLDNGRVSGFDTPANLLKNNAIYQDVYNSQTKGSGDFDEKGGEA